MISMIKVNDRTLAKLSEGGNVNLNLRPVIPTSELIKAGWTNVEDDYATVFSFTATNKAGTVAMNFTPIEVVPETGAFIQVYPPDIFIAYCEKVAEGTIEDTYKLKIGRTYTGPNCQKEAEADAIKIHELHEYYVEQGGGVTPTPSGPEFDFYYRAKYGAEFLWPDEPDPGPDVPIGPTIAGTYAHANEYDSGTKNLRVKKLPEKLTPDGFINPDYDPDATQEPSVIVDVVTYNFLTPGETYILQARLYDITDGKYLEEEVDHTFVAQGVYGDEHVEIKLDASKLEGHTICVIEDLYTHDDHWLDDHADLDDMAQKVFVLAPYDANAGDDDDEAPYFCAVDENFNTMGIIDYYESLIWTDRFDKAGDFELYTIVTQELLNLLKVDTYFYIPQSDKHMIVEKVEIKSDPDGDKLTVTGRSLESILDRRVVWKKTVIDGNLQQGIKKILIENVINPPVGERRIANFIFNETNDPNITKLTLNAEYFGDNIYELICNVCQTNHIGFRIRLNSINQFVFELYSGEDRSYDNAKNNTYMIFGSEYDNVSNSNFIENKESYKNVALVGTSSDSTSSSYASKDYTGLSRRETYISATDLDKEDYTREDYKKALSDKGKEALKDYKNMKTFDGTMLNSGYRYLKDFGLGDIIEFVDIYGHQEKTRISEFIINHDSNGYKMYPSFEALEE